jgi:succinoglycan biosynthesis protein ExoO
MIAPDAAAPVRLEEDADCWMSVSEPSETPPDATIVIPTYNAADTLARALDCALGQSLRNIEVIIVDDASKDGSWEVILAALAQDRRLRVIRNKRNCGKPVGMNRAIAAARGRWLAVLDADDWYLPDRMEALLSIGERRQVDMVSDNQRFYDASADRVVGSAWPEGDGDWPLSFDGFLAGSNAYESFNLGMLKPVIRMDFIRRTGLLYEEKARHGQDFFHLLQFYLSGGSAAVTDAVYYYYTQPFGSISRQWSHASRKRYDFQTAYEINRRYLTESRDRLTHSQARCLRKRNDRLKSLEYFYRMKECLAGRNWAGAVSNLARRPAMLGYVLRRVYGKCVTRSAWRTIARLAARARAKGGNAAQKTVL